MPRCSASSTGCSFGRRLSCKDPATAHRVYAFQTFRGTGAAATSGGTRDTWTSRNGRRRFLERAGYAQRDLAVGVGDAAREMHIGVVSASFFGFFDAPPALGRYFTEAEDRPPEGAPVAVISHAMWQTQYGGRRDVLGTQDPDRADRLHDHRRSPPGFVGLWADRPPAAFIPITSYGGRTRSSIEVKRSWWTTYSWGWMSMLARRKPGVSIATANADLTQAMVKSYEAQRVEQSRIDADESCPSARDRRIDRGRARTERVERRESRDVDRRRVGDRAAHRVRERREPAARARASPPARDRAAVGTRRESRTTAVAAVYGERFPCVARRCGGIAHRALGRRGAACRAIREE